MWEVFRRLPFFYKKKAPKFYIQFNSVVTLIRGPLAIAAIYPQQNMMVISLTVINTNVGALMARTYSAKAAQRSTSSMERLASGKRINSAADDAAGLAVANKMESQQRGQQVGLRNSQDGISLSQTAESAMSKITHLMLRIRELAVQMDNGVYTQKDRDNAQMEVDALIAEIDKIAANTRFNDVSLLDGTYDQYLRTGNHNDEVTRLRFDSLFARDIGCDCDTKKYGFGAGGNDG